MKNRMYFFIAILITLTIMGCSPRKTEDLRRDGAISTIESNDQKGKVELHNYSYLMNAEMLKIYDRSGASFAISDRNTIEELSKQFMQLEIIESAGNALYIGTLWLDDVEYSFQLYESSVKINNSFYKYTKAENARRAILSIEKALLLQYQDSIKDVDGIYVNADDIVRTIAVNDGDIHSIIEALKNSKLDEEKREYATVFPKYSLDLGMGAKTQMEIKLINPERIGITIGTSEFVYTVSNDLWSIIQRQFPIPVYASNDIYFLFNSAGLVITDELNTWNISNSDNVFSQGIRDQMVRELLIAIPKSEQDFDKKMEMIFTIEDQEVKVEVSDQGFLHEGNIYQSTDIKKRLLGIAEAGGY